jgi:hypothetical protein
LEEAPAPAPAPAVPTRFCVLYWSKLLQGAGWKMRLISSPFPSHPLLLPQPKTCDAMAITQH